jgi:hypothetical protein
LSPSLQARWYVAKLVEEIAVENDPLKVIHRTVTVIYANSEQEAYEKALVLGKEREITYRNNASKLVRTTFWGLGELNVIHENPDHGADFFHEEPLINQPERRKKIPQSWALDTKNRPVLHPVEPANHHMEKKLFWE